LLESEWNKGNDSTKKSMDRVYMNELFLKKIHESFKVKKEIKEEEFLGGFED